MRSFLTGVPEGPCGITELEQFQTFLGRQGYKIIVVDYISCCIIFQRNVNEYDKVILFLPSKSHLFQIATFLV